MPVYDDQDTRTELEQRERDPTLSNKDRQEEIDDLEAAFRKPAADTNSQNNKNESAADDQVGQGFTGDGKKKAGGSGGFFNRKRAAITGGLLGSIMGVLGLGSFLSGPLSFLHAAESIAIPHFSATQNFTDSRLGRAFIYARTGSVADTRLGLLERAYKGRILNSMEKVGFRPITDTDLRGLGNDYLKAWQLDTTIKGSPIEGMTKEQVNSWAKNTFGDNPKIKVTAQGNGKVYIQPKGFAAEVKSTYALSRQAGYSKVTSAMRARILGQAFDFAFSPMHKLDQKVNSWVVDKTSKAFEDWKARREAALKTGKVAVTVDSTKALSESADGKTTPVEGGTKTPLSPGKVGESIKAAASSTPGKIGGAALLGLGAVCVAHEVANNYDDFKYVQIIQPLIRTGMEVVALSSQITAGEDVDMTQLNYYAEQLVHRDSDGKILDDFSMAKSITYNNGGTGGIELSSRSDLQPGLPDWLQWTDNAGVSRLCSTTGQVVAGAVGVTVGVITGGVFTTIAGAIGSGVATQVVLNKVSDMVSGDAVEAAVGAQWGGQSDYGVKLAADAQSMQYAGNALTTTEIAALNQQTEAYQRNEFHDKSLLARLFDAKDSHSFVGQIIDTHIFDIKNTVASIRNGLVSPSSLLSKTFSNIFSPSNVFAASSYDYGLPTLGFSLEDQNNPLIDNPYENSDYVAKNILDTINTEGSKAPEYIERAKKCYDVNITRVDGNWGVTSNLSSDAFKSIYAEKGSQDPVCSTPSSTDPDWLRIRAFIADTAVMESWACLQGDDTACANSGYGTVSNDTATTASGLDVTQLQKDSTNVSCANGTDDLGIQDGYVKGTLVKIRICAIPGFKSNGSESQPGNRYSIAGANGNVIVNSRVSGAWLSLFNAAKKDGITFGASSGFRSMAHQNALYASNPGIAGVPGTSNHQTGLAIDLQGMSGKNISARTCADRVTNPSSNYWTWMNNNAASFGFRQLTKEAWHWDPVIASYNCGGDGT